MNFRAAFLSLLAAGIAWEAYSQTEVDNPEKLIGAQRAITTAVPFISITPDARHAALGDAGVASSPDANAAFWNAGKLVFIDKESGGSFSYTPWLGKIIDDMWIISLNGFYKITREQVVSASFRYFDLGDINFRDDRNTSLGDFSPKEMALDITYSRMLSENFSVGLTGKYIYSNLTGAFSGIDAQSGHSAAADVGVYFTKPLRGSKNSTLSLGAQISNLGPKITYTNNENRDFLPTNLRLGGAYTFMADPYNSFTFLLDFNKLMVPSPHSGRDTVSLLSGWFGSFTDAPDGAREEFQEFMTSAGVEYWYNNTFAARLGYFNENKNKGNRKYMTMGVGFRLENLGVDVAYIVPTNQREHPLAETIRFTILLHIPSISSNEESLTD